MLAIAALLLVASSAHADWVRDELRLNMRSGAGNQYRIFKVLQTGEQVRVLHETEEWTQVVAPDGKEGWIPAGFLTKDPPASVALPRVQAKLSEAELKIRELDAALASQATGVEELEAMRNRAAELEDENARLTFSSSWRMLAAGAGIMLVGMLLGVVLPRTGSGGPGRARKLKL